MDLIKLHKIKEFALEQMDKWGIDDWKFVWDTRAVRRYGQCRYGKKEIGITKVLANLNTIEETKDVTLSQVRLLEYLIHELHSSLQFAPQKTEDDTPNHWGDYVLSSDDRAWHPMWKVN